MLSSAWLSQLPEFARSTTGERVNGMRGGNVVLSGSGYCNQCAAGAPAGEPGETLAAPGEKTWGTVDARGDDPRDSAYHPGPKNLPIHHRGALGRDQALADGVADQARDVVDVQLLHHTRAVKFGGLGRDPEQRGDLFGRFALGHELHDLALTGGQAAEVVRRRSPAGIHDGLRDARPHVEPAARHLLDGLGEVLSRLGLEYEAPHARADRFRDQALLLECREHHDL